MSGITNHLPTAPRTDALHVSLIRQSEQPGWIVGKAYVDMFEHARQLEHELAEARRDERERCAQACIDMPQQDGSTYTYWPCVNAIRALKGQHGS